MRLRRTIGRLCCASGSAATSTHAPLGGIERGGWKLVYSDKPNASTQALEKLAKFADFSYSLGFTVNDDGKLDDVDRGIARVPVGAGCGDETCRGE